MKVQSFSTSSEVRPGQLANFAIWVWSIQAPSKGVSLGLQMGADKHIGAPQFTVCPASSGKTCQLGDLPTGQADELQASVPVGSQAAFGERVIITATASAKGEHPFSATAIDVVIAGPSASPIITLPPTSLSPISGTGVQPSNPSGLFPTISPAPSSSTSQLGLPNVRPRHSLRVAEVAATVPLDTRLIGGQLAGLAVLAGAVTLAIARLSLRTPKPPDDKSSGNQP